ncbi:uncharacterized protein LOC130435997 [Triplophysa dalaica]|uniref:uncharacterized protein LOC130435997 n=1 Tax=Triplophysa dalaica TaxID=1582913 RepID=UPI0024DFAFD8|nr:uncharacterized protein LOC130435997 [Triplophysa dalaica]
MQSPPGSPFAEVISSLAGLHQEQHQALLSLREDQERRFQALIQTQQEDRESFRSWLSQEGEWEPRTSRKPSWTYLRGLRNYPGGNRIVPVSSILERVGRSPEQHRQWFRSLEFGERYQPVAFAHQLRDACRRWLMTGASTVDTILDQVTLEQFVVRLPKKTSQWVQCHRPTVLAQAIQLAEDQLVACPGAGIGLPSLSLSPSIVPSPSVRPVPFPRSRGMFYPPPAPRIRLFPEAGPHGGVRSSEGPSGRPGNGAHTSSLPPASPRQFGGLLPAAVAAGTPGPACWRCGDPGHFIDRCPMMEVGMMVRVPDNPQAALGQDGLYQIPVSIRGYISGLGGFRM